ncbi:hypothetical protein MJN69_27945, partial [Salmonella enterica subsp. enterica serovar Kentucky]|nr:hypothetical protein [Salmonella enterica subsp. enterica serovar Kentucky]
GDAETGVTIMQMDVGLDTGDMLYKLACPITAEDTSGSLYNKFHHAMFSGFMPKPIDDTVNQTMLFFPKDIGLGRKGPKNAFAFD